MSPLINLIFTLAGVTTAGCILLSMLMSGLFLLFRHEEITPAVIKRQNFTVALIFFFSVIASFSFFILAIILFIPR